MARVMVVGSINQDITVTVDRFPSPGETLSGSSLTYGLGGKGGESGGGCRTLGSRDALRRRSRDGLVGPAPTR